MDRGEVATIDEGRGDDGKVHRRGRKGRRKEGELGVSRLGKAEEIARAESTRLRRREIAREGAGGRGWN